MVRLLALIAAAYLIYRLFKPSKKKPVPRSDGDVVDQMVKDPQCGTYFPQSQAITAKIDGQRLYFCSKKCRDEYVARYKAHDIGPDREEKQ